MLNLYYLTGLIEKIRVKKIKLLFFLLYVAYRYLIESYKYKKRRKKIALAYIMHNIK